MSLRVGILDTEFLYSVPPLSLIKDHSELASRLENVAKVQSRESDQSDQDAVTLAMTCFGLGKIGENGW
eukprot:1187118-Amphidinium_carterae.1